MLPVFNPEKSISFKRLATLIYIFLFDVDQYSGFLREFDFRNLTLSINLQQESFIKSNRGSKPY